MVGIFKFKKNIVILENKNLRPPCGWIRGQGIISVLESQAYLMFWIRSGCIKTAKWTAPSVWQWVRRGMGWSLQQQNLILLTTVHHKCSLFGWRPHLCTRRKGSSSRTLWSHVYSENLTKAMNAFQEKNGLVSKQNGHSNFQWGSCSSEVQGKSLRFKKTPTAVSSPLFGEPINIGSFTDYITILTLMILKWLPFSPLSVW